MVMQRSLKTKLQVIKNNVTKKPDSFQYSVGYLIVQDHHGYYKHHQCQKEVVVLD